MSGGFWNKTVNSNQVTITPEMMTDSNDLVLDEAVMSELQEDPNVDIFEEEDQDTAEIMLDAELRLEMGRLYQMILKHDLFGETDANPKAIRQVQREIRKLVREKMEIMLGIKQEQVAQQPIVSSPFNSMEVAVLRMLASKISKGQTEQPNRDLELSLSPIPPKKDGITAISGELRPQTAPKPLSKTPTSSIGQSVRKAQPKQAAKSIMDKMTESNLKKPIEEMSPAELEEHTKNAVARQNGNYAAKPTNLAPHPSPQELEMRYTQIAASALQPGSPVGTILGLMNK